MFIIPLIKILYILYQFQNSKAIYIRTNLSQIFTVDYLSWLDESIERAGLSFTK